MPHPLLEQCDDMGIIHSVKDFFSISPGYYEAHLPKAAQVMGNSRFADTHNFCQRCNAPVVVNNGGENENPTCVAERAK